jgi:cytochrome c biogenesis protein CcmG/thiol:disulfide interchange protein DsbE
MKTRLPIILTAGFLAGILVGMAVLRGDQIGVLLAGLGQPAAAPVKLADIGTIAPDFSLKNLDGEQVRLEELRGRPVVINFWASWCGPCELEMPAIQLRQERYAPDLVILGVNAGEPLDDARAFSNRLGLTFEILLDDHEEIQQLYRVLGLPTTFFIDAEGIIQARHIGLLSDRQLDQYIDQLGVSR